MTWKRCTALIISMFVLVPFEQWVIACGGWYEEEYGNAFFVHVNNSNEKEYVPFHFGWDENYYYSQAPITSDYNIREWHEYSLVDTADIDSFVYKFPVAELDGLHSYMKSGSTLSARLANNGFAKWLIKNKDFATLEYLIYAKQCEPYSLPQDEWFYRDATSYDESEEQEAIRNDSVKVNELVVRGLKQYAENKKDFLKWRYAYQVIKLAFYTGQYDKVNALYSQLIGSKKSESLMYGRCLGMKAGALFRMDNRAEAAYYYSRAFEESDEMKASAGVSFGWATDGNVNEVLPYCKSNHERAMLYLMDGLHVSSGDTGTVDEITEAYKLDPKIKGLDVLMTRRIHMVEQHDATNYLTGEVDTINHADIVKLREFAERVASEGKNGSKSFWYLAAAYCCILENNIPQMQKMMDNIRVKKMNEEEKDLHEVLSALYIIYSNQSLTPRVEAELLPLLKSIEAKKNYQYHNVYDNMVKGLLATRYLRQDDVIRAVYLLSRNRYIPGEQSGTRYEQPYGYFYSKAGNLLLSMDIPQLTATQAFLVKTDKTPFEVWLVQGTEYNYAILKELEGTMYLSQGNYTETIKSFSVLPPAMRNYYSLPNIFAAHIKDQQEPEKEDSVKLYSKLMFAEEMNKLQATLRTEPRNAEAAFQYGMALYNITYYGKAWFATTYDRTGIDEQAYNAKEGDEYYGAFEAEKYFIRSYENAKNRELKAKAIFMAAKCWQKREHPDLGGSHRGAYEQSYYYESLQSPYFLQLMQYKQTKFYKEAFNTCSYLRDYVKKQ